jgi:hypothetical protein
MATVIASAFVVSLLLQVQAASDSQPLRRPDTYVGNPKFSTGPIENFRDVYVDPAVTPAQLKPSTAGTGTSDLTVRNDLTGWAEVTISGQKIGVITALTAGVIHGVPSGTYDVLMHYSNGFDKRMQLTTASAVAAPAQSPPANATDANKTDASTTDAKP